MPSATPGLCLTAGAPCLRHHPQLTQSHRTLLEEAHLAELSAEGKFNV